MLISLHCQHIQSRGSEGERITGNSAAQIGYCRDLAAESGGMIRRHPEPTGLLQPGIGE